MQIFQEKNQKMNEKAKKRGKTGKGKRREEGGNVASISDAEDEGEKGEGEREKGKKRGKKKRVCR